jgi:3-hydroxyisobutyrate dehydrogenase
MGTAITARLVDRGHRVAVWNRTVDRTAVAVAAGARAAPTPAAAVAGADVVITMLTDAAAVTSVLCGPDGAAAALRPGAAVVEMSTIGPAAVRALADRIPGVTLVDAPVGGSIGAAAAGTLTIFTGGSADAVAVVEPVLTDLGQIRHCGPLGSGAAVKLVLNTALATGVTALADTLAVAAAVGVDATVALDVLRASALSGTVERVAGGGAFTVALAAKDLDLALSVVDGQPAPLARAAAAALAAVGDPSAELVSIVSQ